MLLWQRLCLLNGISSSLVQLLHGRRELLDSVLGNAVNAMQEAQGELLERGLLHADRVEGCFQQNKVATLARHQRGSNKPFCREAWLYSHFRVIE